MMNKKWLQILLAFSVLGTLGCSTGGPTGAFDEWVSDTGVSLRVKVKMVEGRELPAIDIDNQSDEGFPVAPLTCTAWYKESGKHEVTWEGGDRALMVEAGGQLTDFFTVDLPAPAGDKLQKVRLVYGPDPEQTFTFVRE
ncbi:MAG: hypothetical protein ACE5G0_05230 [Rhodothermales bacterium]